jgi:hypothetical protein
VSPWLPEWLSRLELRDISIGQGRLDITIARHGKETVIEQLERKGIEGKVEAPLWGMPPLDREKWQEGKPGHASVKEENNSLDKRTQ